RLTVVGFDAGSRDPRLRTRAMRRAPCSHAPTPMLVAMDGFDLVQWPAMAVTVWAAWLVASSVKRRRLLGFWLFLLSNALWVVWGLHTHAWALVLLQLCL